MSKTAFKNKALEGALFARRVWFSVFVIALMIAALLSNLYFLQIVQYQDYQTRSNDNRIKVIPSAPPRGLIFDRNGVLLAENQPEFSLELIPEQIPDLKKTVQELTTLLELDPENIPRILNEAKHKRKFNPITLAEQLNEEQVARFSVNQYRFPGCSIEAYLKRHYPYADVLTHALGYVARINTKDLQRLEKDGKLANYAATHDIGKQGVENQTGFARTAGPGHHRQFPGAYVQIQVFEVVLACPANADQAFALVGSVRNFGAVWFRHGLPSGEGKHCRQTPATLPARGQKDQGLTISTGTLACVSTFCATLPNTSASIPLRPCEPITIRSQPSASAVSRMPS